jgi:hypothetical protein
MASVGLFYVVAGRVYWQGIPVEKADGMYFKTFARTHSEFWDQDLTGRFPQLKEHEFTYFPRGRVVFDTKKSLFIILADNCIVENRTLVKEVVSKMKLPEGNISVSKDMDCECEQCRQAAWQAAHPVHDPYDPDTYFETSSEGSKVYFPGSSGNEGYLVPSDEEYEKLRRKLLYLNIFLIPLPLGVFEYTLDVTGSYAISFVSMFLFIFVIGVCVHIWSRYVVSGWERADKIRGASDILQPKHTLDQVGWGESSNPIARVKTATDGVPRGAPAYALDKGVDNHARLRTA